MKLLSSTNDPLKPSAVKEVPYDTNSNHVEAQSMQPNISLSNQCKTHSNSWFVPKTSILMPGNV